MLPQPNYPSKIASQVWLLYRYFDSYKKTGLSTLTKIFT
jgi:hypothetical protein